MNIGIDKLSGVRRRLKIEIPADEVSTEYNRVAGEFRRMANIPGFRKGKAPMSFVERRFGEDIEEELKRVLIPKAFREAVKEKELKILTATNVENLKYEKGKALSFATQVDLVPEFKLPDYKGITIKKATEEVTDEDVQQAIDRFRAQKATFKKIEDRPAREGDLVKIDYTGQLVGVFGRKPITEVLPEAKHVGEATDAPLELRDDAFLPGFGKQLMGAETGATQTVTVSFPKDFPHKPVAGKKAEFEVTIKEIEERELPEWNEELTKELTGMDPDEFEKMLRESLAQNKQQEARSEHVRQIVEFLKEKTKFDLPESAVAEETRRLVYDIVRENQMRGITEEALAERKDDILASATTSAKDRVKAGFILTRIAEAEGIEVSADEIQAHVQLLAARAQVSLKKALENLEKNDGISGIEEEILHRKTIDFLVESASLEEEQK